MEKIPQELKDLKQWVNWKYEERDGKRTKVPYVLDTDRKANVSDPNTWSSFEDALTHSDQIGFVFTKDDPFCGIDLDGCVDGNHVEKWAKEVLEELNSYTEFSPSGTGFHIIVKGKLPAGRRRKGQLEMYDADRFFCMTGNHFTYYPQVIKDRQKELRALYDRTFPKAEESPSPIESKPSNLSDDEIIELATNAVNGPKFSKLWKGDIAGYGSHSEADAALCSILAFYTGNDKAQLDRLFRQSGLVRDKWTQRADYREKTLALAISGQSEFYQRPPEIPPDMGFKKKSPSPIRQTRWTFRELMTFDFPEPTWAIEGIVPDGLTVLAGRPKVGKSFLALQMACAVGTGRETLGVSVEKGKVLVLALEDEGRRLKERISRQGWDWDSIDGTCTTEWPKAKEGLEALDKELNEGRYSFVVIDTLSRLLGNIDHADVGTMTACLDYLQDMAFGYNVPILMIDHHRKRTAFSDLDQIEDILGSTAKAAVCDAVLGLYRTDDGPILKIVGRDIEPRNLALDWDTEQWLWEIVGDADEHAALTLRDQILTAIQQLENIGELPSNKRIADHMGKDKSNIYRELNKLLQEGTIIKLEKQGKEIPYTIQPMPQFGQGDF